jgi:diguanylate cyclase (GGDEF)-like protein
VSLFLSLKPTKLICDLEEKFRLAWRYLGALILLFLAGYIYYGFRLLTQEPSIQDLLLSLILCGGGIFVIMVAHLSLQTLKTIKKIADKERHRALHDELTELPNRTLLYERIEHAMLQAERDHVPILILLMDLNRFKEINDTLGHFYGDYLLQMIAPRLRESIRKADTIARFGGDEFAVVLPGVELEQAINIAEKIALAMEEPFHIEGNLLSVDVSIGIAIYPDHGSDSDTLLQHADVALYAAKKSSNPCYAVYNADHDEHSMERLMLTVELREAIKKKELVLHYQPKYSLQEGKVCGVEALVRWPRAGGKGLLLPEFFLPTAEKTGLIRPLTYLVFDMVFEQMSQWKKQKKSLPVSINLSTKVLHDLELPDQIHTLMKKWGIDPSIVTLEITESSMMVDPDLAFKIIQDLISLGLKLSIDDFGTGYSSLALLKMLPGCELKIDQSFIADMDSDINDLNIVQTSIDLARNMDLKVVAEGVESKEVLDKLIEMECEMAQGYYLCRPVPAEDVLHKIDELNLSDYRLGSNIAVESQPKRAQVLQIHNK